MRIWPSERRSCSRPCVLDRLVEGAAVDHAAMRSAGRRASACAAPGRSTSRPPWKPIIARWAPRDSSERAGPPAEVDELHHVGDGDVLEAAGDSHGEPLYVRSGERRPAHSPRASLTRLSSVRSFRSLVAKSRAANSAEAACADSRSSRSRSSARRIGLWSRSFEQHERADDLVLDAQRHRRQRPRVARGAQAQHAVRQGGVDHRVAAGVGARRRRAGRPRPTSPRAARSRTPGPRRAAAAGRTARRPAG